MVTLQSEACDEHTGMNTLSGTKQNGLICNEQSVLEMLEMSAQAVKHDA